MKNLLVLALSISFTVSLFAIAEPAIPPYPAPRPGEVYTPPAFSEHIADALILSAKAPNLDLKVLGSNTTFQLEKEEGGTPIVLIFGNYTCPVFRGQIRDILKLADQFSDRYRFYLVYIREAHPDSKLYIIENGKEVLKTIPQTHSVQERESLAIQTKDTFQIKIPILIDDLSQSAQKLYASWPVRFVIISTDGALHYKGRMGPFGFWPKELKAALSGQ